MESPRRAAVRYLTNVGLRLAALAVLALALAIPAYAYWSSTRPPTLGLAAQVGVPVPTAERPPEPIPAYSHGVLVLCYHDLSSESHNRYTVSPRAFAAQMAALHAAGFHTISARQMAAFLRSPKEPLPSRPLLITFDDGAKGTWIYADQVLARLAYRATVFLITGDVSEHQPYYLDWAEVEAMARSGRWSFGSHTYEGHGLVATDNSGDQGPFLINRLWLGGEDRLETVPEYRARVTGDLDRSIAMIIEHGLPRPELFAFPFSATVDPTNDPAIAPLLERILAARFVGLMDNTTSTTLVRPGQSGPLPRLEVFRTTGAARLLREAAAAIRRSEGAEGRP